jgi:hypothetical protein
MSNDIECIAARSRLTVAEAQEMVAGFMRALEKAKQGDNDAARTNQEEES